jgi:mannose-6-phosphate isomerase-like protein (cupin superfamily)
MFNPARFVTTAGQLPVEHFPWGTLQWLTNAKLSPRAEQTLGLCCILPGERNPRHYHPNCEEVLYMLAGRGLHSFEDDQVELTAGMTIRIPLGVTHNLKNTGDEPLVCLIAFNSGDRETVFLEG